MNRKGIQILILQLARIHEQCARGGESGRKKKKEEAAFVLSNRTQLLLIVFVLNVKRDT